MQDSVQTLEAIVSPVVKKLELPALEDDMLCEYRGAVAEQIEDLKLVQHTINLEIERRLRERGARELAHPKFDKIALEDQYTPYAPDYVALLGAQKLLRELGKDGDAAKVVKEVADVTTTIPRHFEYGNPVSIAALIKKYGPDSDIGKMLTRGLTREFVGTKLYIKIKPEVR
jgi:hypothetical protein